MSGAGTLREIRDNVRTGSRKATDICEQALTRIQAGDGRLHAFRIGMDDQVGHSEQVATGLNAPWTDWRPISPTQNDAKALVVLAANDKLLQAFRIGLDGQVGRNEQLGSGLNAPWSGWRPMTGQGNAATSLVVASNQDDRLHAFILG